MSPSQLFLSPTEAAERLGVSAKALRLYEQHGLIKPIRTAAGWRTYGDAEMARAGEIASLRALGLSLAEVGRVLRGDAEGLEPALARHQTTLEGRVRQLADTIEKVRAVRANLAQGNAPPVSELARLAAPAGKARMAFELPWPWGGEKFELRNTKRLSFITGPLGSGKTRLARLIAEKLPQAAFIGLERLANDKEGKSNDSTLESRVDRIWIELASDGAEKSPALIALIVALESKDSTSLVIDMVEQGLNRSTQKALMSYLRRQHHDRPSLFLLTRSNAILDLDEVGPQERIIFCPANHGAPMFVAPYPGAPGYEAVATCVASPEVRARTQTPAAAAY